MKFNEKLKQLRTLKGYTQEQIAEKLGVVRQSVSKWEQGINEPDIKTIKELCVIFNVSIDELIDDDKEVCLSKEQKHEKVSNVLFLITLGVFILNLLSTFIFIRFMPNKLAMRFDFNGDPIRYGSKWETLLFALISIVPVLMFYVYKYKVFKKQPIYKKHQLSLSISMLVLQIIFFAITMTFGIINTNFSESMFNNFILAFVSALIMSISLFTHPKINKKKNWVFGFRTSFTITNDEAWKKLNSLCSILMFIAGCVCYVLSLTIIEDYSIYFVFIIISVMIPVYIYHEILRKKITS